MTRYLIRLDDLCPTNNLTRWAPFFEIFDRYDIKPIIAVIPANKDPKLMACGNLKEDFWEFVRELSNKGYAIAMHGYQHQYVTSNSGLLKMNKRSEFAGLSFHKQELKVRKAFEIFSKEQITAFCFVAPAHSFDNNTLKALRRRTNIQVISDGLLRKPYKKGGFNWIPAQLPEAAEKSDGTWTFNYHPETCSEEKLAALKKFIECHHHQFVKPQNLGYSTYTITDRIIEWSLIRVRSITGALNRLLGR